MVFYSSFLFFLFLLLKHILWGWGINIFVIFVLFSFFIYFVCSLFICYKYVLSRLFFISYFFFVFFCTNLRLHTKPKQISNVYIYFQGQRGKKIVVKRHAYSKIHTCVVRYISIYHLFTKLGQVKRTCIWICLCHQ